MELQKLKGGQDVHQTKEQTPNPTLENMKEAAYSIYEHYLSEKVNSYCDRMGTQSARKTVVLQNRETVCKANTWLCYRTGSYSYIIDNQG